MIFLYPLTAHHVEVGETSIERLSSHLGFCKNNLTTMSAVKKNVEYDRFQNRLGVSGIKVYFLE